MALAVVRSVTIIAMEQVHRRTEETMAKMVVLPIGVRNLRGKDKRAIICLLYTSDAADDQ